MKKLFLIAVLLTCSLPAMADHDGHRGGYDHHNRGYDRHGGYYDRHNNYDRHNGSNSSWRYHSGYGWGWSVPIIVGGLIVGYELSQVDQAPVVVQQLPSTTVIQQPAPLMQNCSPWTETQHPDGTITRSRTCNQ